MKNNAILLSQETASHHPISPSPHLIRHIPYSLYADPVPRACVPHTRSCDPHKRPLGTYSHCSHCTDEDVKAQGLSTTCVWLPSARAGPGTQACVIPALSRAATGGGNGPSKRTGQRCGPAAGPDTASCVGGLSAGLKTARREVALGALSRARTSQRKRGEAKAEARGRPGPLPELLALLPPGPGRGRTCPAPAPGIRAEAERQSAHPTSDLNAPPAQWGLFDFIN